MTNITRQQALDRLQNDWATYAARFRALSPEAQAKFLETSGFARFGDMLAHINAWFEEADKVIMHVLDDPAYKWAPVNVDEFNAEAVKQSSSLSDEEIINSYEVMREAMIDLVTNLPDDAFQNETVQDWLEADIFGHIEEHDIPK